MNHKFLNVIALIPVAVAGLLASTGVAQAAALIGDFSLAGNGNATLKLDALNFNTPTNFDVIDDETFDSFSSFISGKIGNIISFNSDTADNPWLDLGVDFGSSISDGINTFELKTANYSMRQSGNFVNIDVTATGIFKSATGESSLGEAFLTLQKIGNKNNLQTLLNNGGQITGLTYSGVSFATTSVPEPTTFLGLGIAGLALAGTRRRKNAKNQ
jgi:PEP-CTERM motif